MEIGNTGIEVSEVRDILTSLIDDISAGYDDDDRLDTREIVKIAGRFVGNCGSAAESGDDVNPDLAGHLNGAAGVINFLSRFFPGTDL